MKNPNKRVKKPTIYIDIFLLHWKKEFPYYKELNLFGKILHIPFTIFFGLILGSFSFAEYFPHLIFKKDYFKESD